MTVQVINDLNSHDLHHVGLLIVMIEIKQKQ
jgi:hypothetical protein